MAELLIRKKRIISNLNKLKEYSPNNIYVLKANAYGLGIENIVSILKEQNEDFFAVSNIEEAMRVRKIDSECRVLILGDVDKKDIDLVKTYNFEPTLFSQKQMEKYRGLRVHVSFNTGLNRLGFDEPVDYPNILSVYSHISDAFNKKRVMDQVNRFDEICKNYTNVKKHLFSTEAMLLYPNKYDYCRIGMGLYGFNEGFLKASVLKVKVLQKRSIKKGEYIFYGSKNIAKKDMDIAILELGYKDINIQNACMDMMYMPITEDIGDYVYIDIDSEKQLASLSPYIKRTLI
ncbi:alanine racemase [Sneathia vaginalis]|uniref:alanine racemase n=1 Tax=Sneathia vaginalis TaxID=187101 RepID=UPI00288C030D|nr:alanine racemase [Sneathia vaginalis]